jgi:hypothetical protein
MCTTFGANCGGSVAVLCRHDLSLVLLDFVSGRLHHFRLDDVIAAINTVGLVPETNQILS